MERTIIEILARMEETLGQVKNQTEQNGRRLDIANGRVAKTELRIVEVANEQADLKAKVEQLFKQAHEDEENVKKIVEENKEQMKPLLGVVQWTKFNWKFWLILGAGVAILDTVIDFLTDHLNLFK